VDEFSRLFRALADTNRLRILNLLCRSCLCVGDLQTVLGLPQPFISRHLAFLRKVRLVKRRREGLRVCYSLARANLFSHPLQSFLREVLPFFPAAQADLQKLAQCKGSGRLKGRTSAHDPDMSGGAENVSATGPLNGPSFAPRAGSEGPPGANSRS